MITRHLLSFAGLGLVLLATHPSPSRAAEPVRIGVAAPLSGPSEILGRQIVAGAEAGTAADRSITVADTACSAAGGAAAANRLVEARAEVAIGFLCTSALEAALPILSAAAIPVLDVGVRAERILDRREREGWLVWRLAPASGAEAAAIAAYVRAHWAASPFAIVEDGSAYGRDLADTVRNLLEESGLRPAFVDNYRPAEEKQFGLARRIGQSGVIRVLAFGTRSDVAILARDAAATKLDLEIVGGESLVDARGNDVELPAGIVALAPGFDVDWVPTEAPPADEGYARLARIATEIAVAGVNQVKGSERSLVEVLSAETFETFAGPVRFDARHAADIAPFRAYRWTGERFEAIGGS
ncbi:ABC transporter substrate-binding protein [Aureimonas pseudogalii]|nr:ABC transporter substrate-binding protein [Aureimonas pseudogalii]